ncbi:DUF3805 domain-containing protein [Bacteroides sp. OttesenSCG-928-D19]|nr:DUF3805 domain-containing protein [Bacteroides sp. OttesenSCG-928-N06]MDL2304789.1 DUF3805 domain-containing protein [Bacteroides sp. OttesenSCG-928-D19]
MVAQQSGKKFISPSAWFSLIYPAAWGEFEDTEDSFLFYNPNAWTGNFRISAFKKDAKFSDAARYGQDSVRAELKSNPLATMVRVGDLDCAYSKEVFEEAGVVYVSHLWITGIKNVAFECTFTVLQEGNVADAERIIATLQVREDGKKYPAELIPIRVSEISFVNESYDLTVSAVKKLLKKDFQGIEDDLPNLQKVIDSGTILPKQKDYWLAFGVTICVILANEIEGMEWKTLIDGNREAPVLEYAESGTVIDPMRLVWSKVKAGQACDVVEEYRSVLFSLQSNLKQRK